METAQDYLEQVIRVLNKAQSDYAECSKQLSLLDQEAQDVLHLIENENFNAYRGFQLARHLKNIRCQRRAVKERHQLLQILLSNIKIDSFKSLDKKLCNKALQQKACTYTPRVMSTDNMKGSEK